MAMSHQCNLTVLDIVIDDTIVTVVDITVIPMIC